MLAPGLRRWSAELPEDPAQARVIGAALGAVLDEAEAATLGELSMIARHRADPATVLAHWRVWHARPSLTEVEV